MKTSSSIAIIGLLPLIARAQLSGSVGPLTSASAKAEVATCDVTDYADATVDLGPALESAAADCAGGGLIVIPEGDYNMSSQVSIAIDYPWALQLDGIIYRTGDTAGGNMLEISGGSDFELFSSTGYGAIQGNGYVFHSEGSGIYGPRILRIDTTTDFSIHDIMLIDAGAFHLVLAGVENAEVYNMIIRGADEGGLDGIDIWGSNVWAHDIEVTNKDECVTTKSPANNFLIENIYCNWSGGSAMGSLSTDTAISNIYYRNVYSANCNQMFMIKSWGGNGTVEDCVFENFIGHSNAYSLDLNAYWTSQTEGAGDGVYYNNLTFKDWTGDCANGTQRAPIYIACPDEQPCTDITLDNVAIWTDVGDSENYYCRSAYGTGACLQDGDDLAAYNSTQIITATPAGYSATTMPYDLTSGYALTQSIPVPTSWPASFFPSATPISALAA